MSRKLSNFLAIDYGQRKIGLAFSPGGKLAFRLKTLKNDRFFLSALLNLVKEQEIEKIIIGLPRRTDGKPDLKIESIKKFKQKIEEECEGVFVVFFDEMFSSKEAQRNLIKNKKDDDAEAARIILQSYLDFSSNKKN